MAYGDAKYGTTEDTPCNCRPWTHTHHLMRREWPSGAISLIEGAEILGIGQDEIRNDQGEIVETEWVLLVKSAVDNDHAAIRLSDITKVEGLFIRPAKYG